MIRKLFLTLLTCTASIALCPALQAQNAAPAPATTGTEAGPGGHHHGGADMMTRLTQQLNLTEDQQAKLKPIFQSLRETMKGIHDDASLTPKDKHAKMKEARESSDTQIKAILTPEQQAKFAEMRENMKKHAQQAKEGGPSPIPVTTGS